MALSPFRRRLVYESKINHNDEASAGIFRNNRLSGATQAGYKSGVDRYINYCDSKNISAWPIRDDILCQWVSNMAQVAKLLSGTILNYVYGVINEANTREINNNNNNNNNSNNSMPYTYGQFRQLCQVIDGIRKRDAGHVSKIRMPLTIDILDRCYSQMNLSLANDRLIWAALTMAVHGMLRCGEFTVDKESEPARLLQSDLEYKVSNQEYYRIFLRKSKTDPYGNGVWVTLYATGGRTCPYQAMSRYISQLPQHQSHPNMPLLVSTNGKPLLKSLLVGRMKSMLGNVGEDSDLYTGHSLRKGGATSLMLAGVSTEIIQVRGRWKSNAYSRYVHVRNQQQQDAARKLVVRSRANQ